MHGIRVLKAFGRGRALAREVHPAGRGAARHRDREGARHRRHLAVAAAGARCRVRALPARRRVAGVDRRDDGRPAVRVLRDGDGAALADRVDRLPAVDDLRHPHGRRPAVRGARRGEPDHRSRAPEAHRRPRGPPRVRRRALPLPGLARGRPRHPGRHRARAGARRDHGARRPHRLGQDDAHGARDPAVRRDRGSRPPRRRRHPGPHAARSCARTSPWRSRTRPCSRRRCATTCCSAGPSWPTGVRMPMRRWPRRSRSRRPTSSPRCPTAPTPSSERRASRSPAASASVSRSRAPWRRNPPCSCSTTRCRRSTSTPRRASRPGCAACSRPRRRSSWRTVRRPSCSPTGSRCSRTGGSRRSARTPSCSPPTTTTGS